MVQDSLMRFISGRQTRNGFHGTVVAAIMACMVAATVWLVFYSADRLLRTDAEAVAAVWAVKIGDQAGELDQVLAGAQPSSTALAFLMSVGDTETSNNSRFSTETEKRFSGQRGSAPSDS